jgi:EAL domain-containing protein (putative c-di-GMP-specific phosphodiesterase class I)
VPVSQLVDYFNDRIRTQKVRFLPEDPIRSRYGAVEGYFGPLRLTSVFQPLVAIASGGRLAVGHQAYLRAIGANHAELPAPEVFASTREAAAIVYLDRLCRTVHMLNFLRQATEDGCLFLHVHARHILGVPHDHGEYFEGLLHRCGLTPERIVIQVDPPGAEDPDGCRRMQAALRNYRRRGYCLAMNVTSGVHRENILEHVSELQPDYVRLDCTCLAIGDSQAELARAMTLIALLHESGAKVVVHRLETATEVRVATDYGVDVAAGSHFGRPSPDLRDGILVPVDGRPFGSRTAVGTGPVRASDVFLRYA